jgi:hypothetical protein
MKAEQKLGFFSAKIRRRLLPTFNKEHEDEKENDIRSKHKPDWPVDYMSQFQYDKCQLN